MWQVLICKVCSTHHSTHRYTCIRHVTHNNWCCNDPNPTTLRYEEINLLCKLGDISATHNHLMMKNLSRLKIILLVTYKSINLYAVSFIWKFFTPSHPNISMHILHTVLYTFAKELTRRICLSIKSFFSWWSFTLFSCTYFLIQGWYCMEKLAATYS